MNMTTPTTRTSPPAEPVPVHPRTGRPASSAQGILLLAVSSMPVLGTVLISPVLPAMGQEFAQTPGAEVLIPLIATAPALLIGLLSPVAGLLVERLGSKPVLLAALVAYAIVGVAPAFLTGLVPIFVTRLAVGATEAFIMTCCTALIAAYFVDRRRVRYLSLQAVVTSLAATAFLALGGMLGNLGWRAPYWVYAVSLVLAVLGSLFLWPSTERVRGRGVASEVVRLPVRTLAAPLAVSFFAAIILMVPIVQLPYLLTAVGVTEPGTIGLIAALVSLATALGAFAYPLLVRIAGAPTVRISAFFVAGIGLVSVLFAPGAAGIAVAIAITSLGTGAVLPGLVTWCISVIPPSRRGQGIGWWWSSIYLGQFASPLVIVALSAAFGGLTAAVVAVGCLGLLLGVILLFVRPGATAVADVVVPGH